MTNQLNQIGAIQIVKKEKSDVELMFEYYEHTDADIEDIRYAQGAIKACENILAALGAVSAKGENSENVKQMANP